VHGPLDDNQTGIDRMSLTMVHSNPARVDNGVFSVDRKFQLGMQAYAQAIHTPLVTIHPERSPDAATMDLVEMSLSELSYRVLVVKVDRQQRPLPEEIPRLREEIARSALVYVAGLNSAEIARSLGVPYILILEYDLGTQITVTSSEVRGVPRRAVRVARCALNYLTKSIPDIRGAHSLHCNGYPIYDATRRHNGNSLLYLDSRMSLDMIIPREDLRARLAARAGRPLRLLFSGRYERMKGVADAVTVAVECLRRGLDIEMHFYGQGALRKDMERIAAQAVRPGRIHIHDAIPYPELVKISRSFDLFVCCHIQSDPSCTYLESFGAGLPIVGYGNRMWRRLCESSGAGLLSPLGRPALVADDVQRLSEDFQLLSTLSERAVAFAQEHNYESEFGKRIRALNAAIA
jgi:glycosyltransferase involved in cell wall biosynthesis